MKMNMWLQTVKMISKKNRKGISIMIGYILLIVIAIIISTIVFQWLKTYIPTDPLECPDGVSVFVEDYTYNCTTNQFNFTLKNNGRFSIAGYFIHATNSSEQGVATIDLSEYTSSEVGGAVIFGADVNSLMPNNKISNVFDLSNTSFQQIYSVEILPVTYQAFRNKNRIISCGNSKIREEISCSIGGAGFQNISIVIVCGNGIIGTGEQCDDSNSNSGDGCSSTCNIESGWICTGEPSVCEESGGICGDGIIETGEQCDDSNSNSSDGCSSTCSVESGWTCIGEPSSCTEVSEFTYLTCADYIDPQLCTNGVQCPPGTELIGDVTKCECGFGGFNCKDQYYCAYIETTACMLNPTCPQGWQYVSTHACTPPPEANFNATYSNLQKNTGSNPESDECKPNQGCNWWYYDTTLQELDGFVGITVNSRQKCFDFPVLNDYCDPVKTDITNWFGTNYISPGGQIIWNNNWIYTTDPSMTVTETYWGVDDNGNNVTTNYTFTVVP